MSKQPVIFNVTYTPANLPRNATIDQVEKNMKERAFYNMSGDNNIYKYMTTDGKVCGNERDKYTILQYFEKTTGVFNDKGIISKEELKEMLALVQLLANHNATYKIIVSSNDIFLNCQNWHKNKLKTENLY